MALKIGLLYSEEDAEIVGGFVKQCSMMKRRGLIEIVHLTGDVLKDAPQLDGVIVMTSKNFMADNAVMDFFDEKLPSTKCWAEDAVFSLPLTAIPPHMPGWFTGRNPLLDSPVVGGGELVDAQTMLAAARLCSALEKLVERRAKADAGFTGPFTSRRLLFFGLDHSTFVWPGLGEAVGQLKKLGYNR
jgi:hypothetical protein